MTTRRPARSARPRDTRHSAVWGGALLLAAVVVALPWLLTRASPAADLRTTHFDIEGLH